MQNTPPNPDDSAPEIEPVAPDPSVSEPVVRKTVVSDPVLAAQPSTLDQSTGEGEQIAESYIRQELRGARKSLLLTQIASVAIILLTAGYMAYMTSQVRHYAQPEVAAEVANGLIAERVDLYGQQAADSFKTQIPQLISALPDQAIAAAPELRQNLVNQVEGQLTGYSQKYSDQLGANIDDFLEKNKTGVNAVLQDGQNKAAVAELGPQLETQLAQFLEEKPKDGGESAQQQIDKSLQVLLQMKKRTDRLAANQNLTPDEKKARLAIALIGRTISQETKGINGQQLLDEAGKNLRGKIGSLGSPSVSGDDGLADKTAAPAPQSGVPQTGADRAPVAALPAPPAIPAPPAP